MDGTQITNAFHVWNDDSTELSTSDELLLGNKKAREIYNECSWEFLRKKATGTFSGNIDLATVAPDFRHLMKNYTEDSTYGTPDEVVVWVGDIPYKVIPMGLRKQYVNQDVCWVDPSTNTIEFGRSAAGTFEFDYQHLPVDFDLSTKSKIPAGFEMVIVYAMLIDGDIIDKVEKARSNVADNRAAYARILSQLKSHDAKATFA